MQRSLTRMHNERNCRDTSDFIRRHHAVGADAAVVAGATSDAVAVAGAIAAATADVVTTAETGEAGGSLRTTGRRRSRSRAGGLRRVLDGSPRGACRLW